MSAYEAAIEIREALPSDIERRRWALLRAAAILKPHVVLIPSITAKTWWEQAVLDAEKLLEIIEKHERNEI